MENNRQKFVEFDKYCPTCKHKDLKCHEDPCDECLTNPVNTDTNQPVLYEENK